MKTYKYLLGLGVAAMSLSSCSNDAIDAPDTPQVADKDMTRYIALAISNHTPTSRAGEPTFEDGTTEESRINSCYLVFYDANQNPVGEIINAGTDFDDIKNPGITVEGAEGGQGKGKVIEISIPKGQVMPSYVMCYLNPQSTNLLGQPLTTLETTTRTDFSNGRDGEAFAFSMSNAVYYDGITQDSYAVRPAAIDPDLVFTDRGECQDALDAGQSLIQVYVERYAARVALQQKSASDIAIENYTLDVPVYNTEGVLQETKSVEMTFEPIAWEVNSTNTETFVTKIFRTETGLGTIGGAHQAYTVVNGALNPNISGVPARDWNWNNALYHRCYWACSPAYYSNKFPEVASDVKTGEYPLNYFNYAELAARPTAASGETRADQIRWAEKRYKLESTMGLACFASNNPAASIPSLVIIGQYTFNGNPATFYTYNPNGAEKPYIFADANADGTSSIADCMTMKEMFAHIASTLFYKASATADYEVVTLKNFDLVKNALTVKRPDDAVLKILAGSTQNPVKLASRKVTLQISDLNALPTGASLYIASGSGLRQVVSANPTADVQYSIDEANSILANDVKYADQYTDGKAYFSKPIVHLGFYAGTNENAEAAGGTNTLKSNIDWSAARIGDFGLVRNHAYNLNVSKIAGLGIAVRDENDPIVPPVETDQYYMAMQINILQWAIVPTQNIEF